MAQVEIATAVPSNPKSFVRPDNEHFITSLKRPGCNNPGAGSQKRSRVSESSCKPDLPDDQENKDQKSSSSTAPGQHSSGQEGIEDTTIPPATAGLSTAETDSSVDLECSCDSRALCSLGPTGEAPATVCSLEQAVVEIQSTAYPLATPSAEEEEEEEDFLDFDPFLFIKNLPSLEHCAPKHRTQLLPKQTRACKQKTLVLDLDETLVHSSLEFVATADFSFPVQFNNQEHIVNVKQRPFLSTFMQRAAELFEVVVFTASQRIYAEKLLNILDPDRKLIRHRIYRDSCVYVEGNYLKDLSVLGRNLAHTLIIDNSPQAFGFQLENGVPIESWYEDDNDRELLNLLPFLEGLVAVDDVRPVISQRFRLQDRVQRSA